MSSPYSDLAVDAAAVELRTILYELEGEALIAFDASGHNDLGGVRGSIHSTEVTRSGDLLSGSFGADAAHAIVVHEGRGANKKRPPIEPIRRWAMRKLGVPEERSRGVAFVIARKIGRDGTTGTPFLRRPFQTMQPTIAPRIQGAVARALNARVPG